jgi:hypothetical protein
MGMVAVELIDSSSPVYGFKHRYLFTTEGPIVLPL